MSYTIKFYPIKLNPICLKNIQFNYIEKDDVTFVFLFCTH